MLSIKVPPLGESIVEATVSRWLKKDGEAVASGDTLVELETDKITVEVPAPRAGVLVKRSVSEGDVVKVGDILAELDETALVDDAHPVGARRGGETMRHHHHGAAFGEAVEGTLNIPATR